jgi:hypothetical protein
MSAVRSEGASPKLAGIAVMLGCTSLSGFACEIPYDRGHFSGAVGTNPYQGARRHCATLMRDWTDVCARSFNTDVKGCVTLLLAANFQ